MAEEQKTVDWGKVKEFAALMTNDLGAAMQGALTYIGDRLGIFKALAGAGPVTSADLAARTGLNERYLREWLGAMTAAKYINYDPATARYSASILAMIRLGGILTVVCLVAAILIFRRRDSNAARTRLQGAH